MKQLQVTSRRVSQRSRCLDNWIFRDFPLFICHRSRLLIWFKIYLCSTPHLRRAFVQSFAITTSVVGTFGTHENACALAFQFGSVVGRTGLETKGSSWLDHFSHRSACGVHRSYPIVPWVFWVSSPERQQPSETRFLVSASGRPCDPHSWLFHLWLVQALLEAPNLGMGNIPAFAD